MECDTNNDNDDDLSVITEMMSLSDTSDEDTIYWSDDDIYFSDCSDQDDDSSSAYCTNKHNSQYYDRDRVITADLDRDRVMTDEPGIYKVSHVQSRRSYVQGNIRMENTGQIFRSKLFVDPGNLLNQGCAISETFFK